MFKTTVADSLSWDIVDLIYVLSRRRDEKDRSAVAVDTGTVKKMRLFPDTALHNSESR